MKQLIESYLSQLLLAALSTKAIVDGGSIPVAIAIVALVAGIAYKGYLAKDRQIKIDADKKLLEDLVERVKSVEAKYAMTMGATRNR
jgi:hypothetical protein